MNLWCFFSLGGSETYQDKQEYFFKELRDVHRKHPRDKLTLKITRENIVESVSIMIWKLLKHLLETNTKITK